MVVAYYGDHGYLKGLWFIVLYGMADYVATSYWAVPGTFDENGDSIYLSL